MAKWNRFRLPMGGGGGGGGGLRFLFSVMSVKGVCTCIGLWRERLPCLSTRVLLLAIGKISICNTKIF